MNRMNSNSKIYVAGHRGLLGSAVVRQLQMKGFNNLLTRTSTELDLTNQPATFAFLEKEKPEFVFLCAAKVGGIVANIKNPAQFLYENLQIQNNVIEGARRAGVMKLLFVGSSCIYPKEPKIPITEDQFMKGPLESTNEGYALAKIAGVRMCSFYRRQYGCDFISALPTNLYGINDHYDLETSHLLPALIRKVYTAMQEKKSVLEIWGSGKPMREFMLSDDCADALIHLMQNYEGEDHVNVGTGEDLSVVDLAKAVCRVLGANLEVKPDPTKPDGMFRKLLDVSKLRQLGWKHRYSIEEGIKIAFEDFRRRY